VGMPGNSLYVIVFLVGAGVGCCLNLAIERLLATTILVGADSRREAPGCGIKPIERLPLIGYLFQQIGNTQDANRVPLRALVVEVVTGAAFLFTFTRYGFTPQWGVFVFYFALFLVIAVIDFEHGLILNKLVYPAFLITSVLSSFYPMGLAVGGTVTDSFTNSMLGGVVAFVSLLIPALAWSGRMGWGDVKFAGLVGIITGFPGGLIAMALAMIGGGGMAVAYYFLKPKKNHDSIPFGPFLSAGGLAALIWGQTITNWSLGLLV